jgi:HAD superfamily hydrolase (TIGR01509 family)
VNISAWIFDLGNTLMQIPEEYDEESCIARILGFSETEQIRSIIYSLCDRFPNQSIEEFLRRFNKSVNTFNDKEIDLRIRQAWMASVENAHIKPGALEVLDSLRNLGMKLALVSNTPPTSRYIIQRLRFEERFDVIVFSCDVGYLKPDPRIFKMALKRLNVEATDTVIVGDKIRTDILGGAILGMKSILVEERLRCLVENGQNYVDAILPQLSDLTKTTLFRSLTK